MQTALDEYSKGKGEYPLDVYAIVGMGDLEELPRNAWYTYKIYSDFYVENTQKTYVGDSRALTGADTSRFSTDGGFMGNVSTGYDIGRELVPWWDALSEGDKPSKEQAVLRGILAGNFVYLPCDEAENPIPFSKAKTSPVKGYYLIAFGSPTTLGLDLWTPTGDPDMPVKFEQDGKPDGVIIYLTAWEDNLNP